MRVLAIFCLGILCGPVFAQDAPLLVLEKGSHQNQIVEVMFTRDQKQLVTVSEDKTIRFWDLGSGAQVKVLRTPIGLGADGKLQAAAMAPDGKLLAVGGQGVRQDGKRLNPTYLIDLSKDTIVRVLAGSEAPVHALTFSSDGKRLAVAGAQDAAIRVWNLDTGKIEVTLEMGKNQHPRQVSFSPDGKYLAVATSTGAYLHMFHLASGKAGISLEEIGGTLHLAWSPDGKSFATASPSGLRIWDARGGLRKYCMVERRCTAAQFTPDSSKVLVESLRNEGGYYQAFWVDPETGKETLISQQVCTRFTLSPDGTLIAGLLGNGTSGAAVFCWQSADGAEVQKLPMAGARTNAYEIGWKDGQTVALGRLWSFNFARLEAAAGFDGNQLRGSLHKVGDLELKGVYVTRFDVLKGADIQVSIKTSSGSFRSRTFLTRDIVAAGTTLGDLQAYKAVNGERVRSSPAHNAGVDAVAPSPDGKIVASYSQIERTICLWNPEHDRPLVYVYVVPTVNKKDVTYDWVAWTPEGYYAASKGAEQWFGWHVGNGPERLADFVPADRFRDKLYRPEIIRAVFEAKPR